MKNKFINTFYVMFGIALLCFTILSLQSCSRPSTKPTQSTMTITSKPFSNTLFYTGIIQPSKTIVVPSPAEGVIIEMPFQYGEPISAGKLLFMISSSKFLSDYKAALMQYIKAKSEFNDSKTQLSEADFLHKNLLISDDAFKMKQSGYYAAQLTFLQAKDTLQNLLHQLDIKNVNPYNLSISEIDKITQALHLQMTSENLRVFAPASGIALSSAKSEDENKKVVKGDVVKQGDVLAIIGDMSGITVRIKVNELTINQLKVGQKVRITGIAFPDDMLSGEIKQLERQGEPNNNGLPTFSVVVIVPKLTQEQQKLIHVGMTAKVEIDVEEGAQITVPIVALKEKNGLFYVELFDEKTKHHHEQLVRTGKTTAENVTILSGLKQGDKIVLAD